MPNKPLTREEWLTALAEITDVPTLRVVLPDILRTPVDVPPYQVKTRPASLLDQTFVYVPANRTDVRATWARFGFKPKGE